VERRFEPALRTCRSIAERQASLDTRIARTADLARTRAFVELERRNQEVLAPMSRRAKLQLQLQLQETVEGLSVAAISYHVVGLLAYVLKSAGGLGAVGGKLLTALATPLMLLTVWWATRRARRRLLTGSTPLNRALY